MLYSTALSTGVAHRSYRIETFEFKHFFPLCFGRQDIIKPIRLAAKHCQVPALHSPRSKIRSGFSFADELFRHVLALHCGLDHDGNVFKNVRERLQRVF